MEQARRRSPEYRTIGLSEYGSGQGSLEDGENIHLHFAKPIMEDEEYDDLVTVIVNPPTARRIELAIRYTLDVMREQSPKVDERLAKAESNLEGKARRYFEMEREVP